MRSVEAMRREAMEKAIDFIEYLPELRSVLTFAVGNGRFEVTEILLKAGVLLNVQDNFGNTALHYAYENEEYEIAKLLISGGADESIVNEDGLTPVKMLPDFN